jgi:hypothetical protein
MIQRPSLDSDASRDRKKSKKKYSGLAHPRKGYPYKRSGDSDTPGEASAHGKKI